MKYLFIFSVIFFFCSSFLDREDKDVKIIISGKDVKDFDFLIDKWIPPEGCTDKDLDQYGEGCSKGDDCDDTNPHFNTFCPDCTIAVYKGCPCKDWSVSEKCFDGELSLIGIGECKEGIRYCENGYWGKCENQVLPSMEVCDGKDNDCNGQTDEGMLSECGDCNPNCVLLTVGPKGKEKFNPTKENSDSVELNENEYLILNMSKKNLHFIWIANSGEHTVSKIDTKTGRELGRYHTCVDPSRTAVDLDGNVWVACRGDGGVAKISLWEDFCVDKNGDGSIQTSKDLNNNHIIDSGEILPKGQDECVLFVVHPDGIGGCGSPQGCARAAGVDKENHAWIGFWGGKRIRRLKPENGQVVKTINIPGNPYGIAIDQKGIIWISGGWGTNNLIKVDPQTGQTWSFNWPGPGSPYGIAIDINGKIWLPSCCGSNCGARSFNPETEIWSPYVDAGDKQGRGVAASIDGNVWVACDQAHKVAKIDANTNKLVTLISVGNPGGTGPIGMAVDFDGFVWAINYDTSTANKIDPKTNTVVGKYPTGKNPYTYSDMTGYALHTVVAPKGYYQHIFGDFKSERKLWEELTVIADTPPQTYIKVRVRSEDSPEKLKNKEWSQYFGPYPPEKFPLILHTLSLYGKMLQVEVSLYSSDLKTTPVVKEILVKATAEKN